MSMNDAPRVSPNEALHNRLFAQSLVFALLARFFSLAPEPAFLEALVTEALYDDWPLPATHNDVQQGLALLRTFGAGWNLPSIGVLREDYSRLFVGPDHLLAPPWESVYRSKEGLVFERETLEVRAAYARFGLRVPHLNSEPDDHLGYELAFIARLSDLGKTSLAQGDVESLRTTLTAQRDFLEGHLQQWAGTCLQRIIQHAETDFFRGAAHLTLGTLDDAAQFITQAVGAIGT